MRLIDAHCHLTSPGYVDIDGLVCRARRDGVLGIVASGTSYKTSQGVLTLSRTYRGFVFPTVGVHPERQDITTDEVEEVKRVVHEARDEIVGIGEVGIPYYSIRDMADALTRMSMASEILAEFSVLARSLDLTLVVHAPHTAARYALSVVRKSGVPKVLFHWHKASDDVTKAIADEGYYVSVTPEVCYEERDQRLVKSIPLSNLVVETDGPWRYDGEFSGMMSEPTMLKRVVAKVADLRNEPAEEVAEKLVENTSKLFGLTF